MSILATTVKWALVVGTATGGATLGGEILSPTEEHTILVEAHEEIAQMIADFAEFGYIPDEGPPDLTRDLTASEKADRILGVVLNTNTTIAAQEPDHITVSCPPVGTGDVLTFAWLDSVTGIGPTLAQRILDAWEAR